MVKERPYSALKQRQRPTVLTCTFKRTVIITNDFETELNDLVELFQYL